jgi:tRNA(Ile)-lysidine synthase
MPCKSQCYVKSIECLHLVYLCWMLTGFQNYLLQENLVDEKDKVLIAVSGGLDSVVLLELCCRLKDEIPFFKDLNLCIAHCNFGLRASESDAEEQFVETLAKHYHLPFFCKRFDTESYAKQEKISIQMAARDLRYQWFESIRTQESCTCIAVAHHQNDATETVLINLIKGTGIAGLHGISNKQGFVIRPLIFSTREEIQHYAKDRNIEYREDSSNSSVKYLRNKIRHEIIPVLKQLNPGLDKTFRENSKKVKDVELIFNHLLEEKKKELFIYKDQDIFIPKNKIKEFPAQETFLYALLKPFLFPAAVIKDLIANLDGPPGKQYFAPGHRLLKDREFLMLSSLNNLTNATFTIESEQLSHIGFINIDFKKFNAKMLNTLQTNADTALMDADKLRFPLSLRRWQAGDTFYPLGMQQRKKISDFLIDKKMPLSEKEKTWVLLSGTDIVWLVGQRIDNRYKVNPATENVLAATLKFQGSGTL